LCGTSATRLTRALSGRSRGSASLSGRCPVPRGRRPGNSRYDRSGGSRPSLADGVRHPFPSTIGARHMKGYVFVTAAPGRSTDVVTALRQISGVRSADICWGLPDIVALVEAADGPALQDLVLLEIQRTTGVTQTDTHIVFE